MFKLVKKPNIRQVFFHNWLLKIISLVIAIIVWFYVNNEVAKTVIKI
jgi:YbbR domain-containing protein